MKLQEGTVPTVEAGSHRSVAPLAIVACLAAVCAPSALAQPFTDLGTLGGPYSQANAINASGQVAGFSKTASGDAHAFLYSDGILTDLGTLGGTQSFAYGINKSGRVVGSFELASGGQRHAFLYSGGVMTDLGVLPGYAGSQAAAINADGQVVGTSTAADLLDHAFLYSDGSMNDLGTLIGPAGNSSAYGINDSGQVVGSSQTTGNPPHASLFWNGVVSDLGTLPGFTASSANAINGGGQIVGFSFSITQDPGVGIAHAFLYSGGVTTDLGTLSGSFSSATGINESGQVVGWTAAPDGLHAMLWSNGVMIDLNSLLPTGSDWLLQAATAINDCGQIVGYGTVDGRQGAFLLNLTTLTPSSVPPGAPAFTLTVTGIGTNFTPAATVNWNGTALATMYVSATQVSASVPASLISTPGSASVTVTSNGGTLAGATFGIHPARRGPGVPERPSRPAQSSATPRGVEKTAEE